MAIILSQGVRLVPYISRSSFERRYPAFEKEATAVIKVIRRKSHFSKGRCFTLVADQKLLSFMLDQSNRGTIKSAKRLGWRCGLSHTSYDIRHKPADVKSIFFRQPSQTRIL